METKLHRSARPFILKERVDLTKWCLKKPRWCSPKPAPVVLHTPMLWGGGGGRRGMAPLGAGRTAQPRSEPPELGFRCRTEGVKDVPLDRG